MRPDRRQGPDRRRRPVRHQPDRLAAGIERRRGQRPAGQGEPDRVADRDPGRRRARPPGGYRLHDEPSLRRDRGHHDRRPRRRHRLRPDQDRRPGPHRSRRQVQPAAADRGEPRRRRPLRRRLGLSAVHGRPTPDAAEPALAAASGPWSWTVGGRVPGTRSAGAIRAGPRSCATGRGRDGGDERSRDSDQEASRVGPPSWAWTGARALALVVVLWCSPSPTPNSLRIYFAQQTDIAATNRDPQSEQRIADLESDVARWDDPAYVKTQARVRLGLGRAGGGQLPGRRRRW